ncbi:hypothetical protein EV359DRAFT_82244 [Lentinula novae-zelandiae]|nr:hypothetical protein EV359DRAFT_82244 [Lentinula novae-zelandiae]
MSLKRICVPAEGELIAPNTFATRNTPILVIASRDATLAYCGGSITRDLRAQFQYMYMGFFKVLSVEEDRVFRPSSSSVVDILVSSD